MFKLSKIHNIKTAEENEADLNKDESELRGSEIEDEDEEEELNDEPSDEIEDEDNGLDKTQKSDARREAATPHANAAKDLFSKRRELMGQVNMLDDQLAKHRDVLRALDPKMKHESYADDKELRNYLKPEKTFDDKKKKKRKKLDKNAEAVVINGLLKVAEVLDYAGDSEGVSIVEHVIRTFAKKDENMPKYDVNTINRIERKYPDMSPYAPSMSTRSCPDHNGIQMKRIAEGTFQCELDGRAYNWNQGFKDYSGNVYQSAPITSVDFPDTQERIFETRQMATNKQTK